MSISKLLQETGKYPTSLIVRGADALGIEVAKTLLEQGGYVIMIDEDNEMISSRIAQLKEFRTFVMLDFTAIDHLEEDLRRLDYVFYFQHKSIDLSEKISTQEFLQYSNYLDKILDLTAKFAAKFLLTTSIRAHQMILADKGIDWNFGPDVSEKHSVYTETEIQRYSESLVKEYQEKVGIDARVVRLGIILGRDLELQSRTPFIQLLLAAINGENLIIPNDGLETDFYVHYLDAAYGIIKAQFSSNTKGHIFTLANDEEISILSIAYKLLELVPQAREIQFTSAEDNLPPLKLYKPAEHIINIGWKPRVTFERALSQSLDDVKDRLQQNYEKHQAAATETERPNPFSSHPASGLKEKLFNFFFVADTEDKAGSAGETDNLEGALSRLIAERKSQDKARKGSIILANNMLREKVLKNDQPQNLLVRIDGFANNIFLGLRKKFEFLRNITLTDFIFSIIAFFAFGIIYFQVIAPVLSLGKNIYLAKNNLENLADSLAHTDFQKSHENISNINGNLAEAQSKLESLQFLFDITRNHQTYLGYQQLLSNAVQYTSGYEEIFAAISPFAEYLHGFSPGITYRFSESNLLTANPQNDQQALLNEIKNNSLLFNVGIVKVQKNEPDLFQELDVLPVWLKDQIQPTLTTISHYTNDYVSLEKTFTYLPQILGLNKTRNLVLVIHDNARYTAGGGEITGFIILQLKNGNIKAITVRNFADYQNISSLVSPEAFNEIKLLANNVTTINDIAANDFSLINDDQVLYSSLRDLIENKENIKPDLIIGINLNVLSSLLQFTGDVNYQQVSFNPDNLLSSINLLLGSNPSGKQRNEIILNISALITEKLLNNLPGNYAEFFRVLADNKSSNDLRLYSDDLEITNYLAVLQRADLQGKEVLSFGLNYDQKSLQLSKYPVNTITLKVKVNRDGSTEKNLELSASGADKLQNTYFCVPAGSKDFVYSEVSTDKISSNFSAAKTCTFFLPDEDLKYQVNFNTIAFDNNTSNSYNYILELADSSGLTANYDVEFSFADGVQVTAEDAGFLKQDNSYVYSGVFNGNKIFSFNLTGK